jgi:uncharacterized membrane protein YccF (DUF307 family)
MPSGQAAHPGHPREEDSDVTMPNSDQPDNYTVNASPGYAQIGQTTLIVREPPNLLLRVLWFIFIGWWLGAIVSSVAWFLNAIIIGLPLGLWLINRLPTVITLRPQEMGIEVDASGRLRQGVTQYPFLIRAVYFLLIGWWFSGIWMSAAYFLLVIIVGLPLSFWMFGQVGTVTTLHRS